MTGFSSAAREGQFHHVEDDPGKKSGMEKNVLIDETFVGASALAFLDMPPNSFRFSGVEEFFKIIIKVPHIANFLIQQLARERIAISV
jgi:hypothetical protein